MSLTKFRRLGLINKIENKKIELVAEPTKEAPKKEGSIIKIKK